MARYIDSPTFLRVANAEFAFLLEEEFVRSFSLDFRVAYQSAWLGIEILYDERDGRVSTIVDATVGERNPHASLTCLFVTAGLGPAQRVRDIARSHKILPSVLATHSAAIRAVMPILRGPLRDSLLIECHGR